MSIVLVGPRRAWLWWISCALLCVAWPAAADDISHCIAAGKSVAELCGEPDGGGSYPCCTFQGSDWWADIQSAFQNGLPYPNPCQPKYWSEPNYYPPGGVYDCEREEEVFNNEAYQQALKFQDNVNPNDPIFWDPPLLVTEDPCFHDDWRDCDTPGVAPLGRGVVTAADIADAKNDLTYNGGNANVENLLATALAYLRDSLDIVAYVCCLYYGPGNRDCDCLVDTIRGTLEVSFDPDTGYANAGARAPEKFNIGPGVVSDANTWNATAPTSDAWLDLVLKTADMMVEEILHSCVGHRKSDHQGQACDLVNLTSECGATNLHCLMEERYTGTPACIQNTC